MIVVIIIGCFDVIAGLVSCYCFGRCYWVVVAYFIGISNVIAVPCLGVAANVVAVAVAVVNVSGVLLLCVCCHCPVTFSHSSFLYHSLIVSLPLKLFGFSSGKTCVG